MADISKLGAIQPIETLDLGDNYAEVQNAPPLPPKGEYILRAPDRFPDTAFGRAKSGALSAQIDPTIIGPTNEGYPVRFVRISAKPFERRGVKVSQFGDYLRACGFRGKLSTEPELVQAIESTANQVYKAKLDWSAYNKVSGKRIDGMEKFPSDGNGGYLPWIETEDKDEDGNPIRLRANLVITQFIPA